MQPPFCPSDRATHTRGSSRPCHVHGGMRIMSPARTALALGLAAASLVGLTPQIALAQTVRTWNVTSGTWATTSNWDGTAPTASDTASFSGAAVGSSNATVLLSTNTSALGLSFNSAGTTTLQSNSTTARTLTIGTGGIAVNSGAGAVTIGVTGSMVNLILNGTQTFTNNSSSLLSILGTVDTAGLVGSDLTIGGSGSTTLSGAISGGSGRVISLRKQGTGVLTLSANTNNTFSGGFTLDGGTVVVGHARALGATASTLTINGGTLDTVAGGIVMSANSPQTWTNSFAFAGSGSLNLGTGAVTLTASPVITASASTLTVGGVISGGFGLTKAGAGSLVLSGSNTFSGGVTLNTGTLSLGHNAALGTGTFTIAGGVIDVTAARTTTNAQNWNGDFTFAGSNTLNLGTGAVTMNASRVVTVNSSTLTVGGVIGDGSSGYSLSKTGAGDLALTGANTFSGGVTIREGTLSIGTNATALGSGTVRLGDTSGNKSTMLLSTGATADFANPIIVVGGNSGTATLARNQAGSTQGYFSGAILLDNHDLRVAAIGTPGNAAITVSGGVTGTGNVFADVASTGGGNPRVTMSGLLNFSGTFVNQSTAIATAPSVLISGGFGSNVQRVVQDSSLTFLQVSGSSQGFTGGVLVRSGMINYNAPNALGSGTVTLGDDTFANSNDVFYGSGGSSTGGLTNPVVLADRSTYTGVIRMGALAGAGPDFKGTITGNNDIVITSNTAASSGLTTFSNFINHSGSLTNSSSGAGSVTISGSFGPNVTGFTQNSTTSVTIFSGSGGLAGPTTITSGTVRVQSTNASTPGLALRNSTIVRNSSAGALEFVTGTAFTIGGLSGDQPLVLSNTAGTAIALTVGNNGSSNTFSGAISGAGRLVKTGSGVWVVQGVNTYSGTTTINAGRFLVSGAGDLQNTARVVVDGSTADFRWNSSTAFTRPLTMTQGTISGTGTISASGGVTIGTNAILSPGNSPGIQTYTTGLTLSPGGTYVWEINSGAGTAGTNWDLINVTGGGLNLAGLSSGSRFILDLTTLTSSGSSGPMNNYVAGQSYTWRIFDADALTLPAAFGSSPYAAGTDVTSLFNLVSTNWKNPYPADPANVSVKVASDGKGLDLVVVPEPATIALAGIGVALGAYAIRRRQGRRDSAAG